MSNSQDLGADVKIALCYLPLAFYLSSAFPTAHSKHLFASQYLVLR